MSKKQNIDVHKDRVFYNDRFVAEPLPDLIEVQKGSYEWFFREGLKELFEEITPVVDFTGHDYDLHFGAYYLDTPKFDEVTAKRKNATFDSPLRVEVKLTNKQTGEIKEQEVYLGDLPLMTERGTFIINGIERVVVSQIIRSSGVFFSGNFAKGRNYYGAKIIPNRGAWLEFTTDLHNVIYVSIDRKRKVPFTAFLRALGYATDDEIRALFPNEAARGDEHELNYIDTTLAKDKSTDEESGLQAVYQRLRPGDIASTENARDLILRMFFSFDRYDLSSVGRYKLNKRFDENTPYVGDNRMIRKEDIVRIIENIMYLNHTQEAPDDIDHLGNRRIRAVGELVQNRFRVGLMRMERIIKDRMSTASQDTITPNILVNARPVIAVIREFFMSSQLSQFMDQVNPLAELEHKRRISALGPGGLSRERAGFEVRDVHKTHYGRICPIATPEGPNIGLVGHLASYARINNYGFIETPYRKVVNNEPPTEQLLIGKVARENAEADGKVIIKEGKTITKDDLEKAQKAGVENVKVKPVLTDEIVYLDAYTEEKNNTTAATIRVDENGHFLDERVEARRGGDPTIMHVEDVDFVDVAPHQIISIATSLIPFLEHNDATRALMGSNMQRQAVSLVKPDSPVHRDKIPRTTKISIRTDSIYRIHMHRSKKTTGFIRTNR
jgi:DNA-directed RNA polymerase subunit beta